MVGNNALTAVKGINIDVENEISGLLGKRGSRFESQDKYAAISQ